MVICKQRSKAAWQPFLEEASKSAVRQHRHPLQRLGPGHPQRSAATGRRKLSCSLLQVVLVLYID